MREETESALEAVKGYIARELKANIGVFLDRAEQSFQPQSELIHESQSPAMRAAARWLAAKREALQAAMHQRMVQSFAGQATTNSVRIDELRLLDDEALDIVMLRAHMVSQVMECARELVVVLEARLEELRRSGARVNPKSLTPGAIADGFIAVLNELDVPQQVQAPLLEVYGRRGVEMLIEFYDGINQLLIQHGVLPHFKNVVVKQPESSRKPEPAPQAFAPGGMTGPGPVYAQTVPYYGAPATGSTAGAPSPAGAAAGAGGEVIIPVPFAQLLDMKLTVMQQALVSLSASNWRPGTLRETFKLPPPFALSREQEESIDHIEAVFLDLMRDTRISARFRNEMSRLILPLMALELTDARQLSTPDNPARRFIRQLALLGFRDQEFPIEDFERIQAVVGRIVAERAQEQGSFNSGSDALYTIARREVQRQLSARQPAQPAFAGEDPRQAEHGAAEEAHRCVLAELRLLSAGLRLPPMLQQYVLRLLGPWMMIRYQRYGENSPEMKDCRNFAMMFFNLLAPAANARDRENKIALRRYALEQIEIRAGRSRLPEEETLPLIEAIEQYFDELNYDPGAGIVRDDGDGCQAAVGYLDALPVTLAA